MDEFRTSSKKWSLRQFRDIAQKFLCLALVLEIWSVPIVDNREVLMMDFA